MPRSGAIALRKSCRLIISTAPNRKSVMSTYNISIGSDFRLRILDAIEQIQIRYIEYGDTNRVFYGLLEALLGLTGSEYGVIGEILKDEDETPCLKSRSITDIAWDAETRDLYDRIAEHGLEFRPRKGPSGLGGA